MKDGPKQSIGDTGLDPFGQYLDYCETLKGGSSITIPDTTTATAIPQYFTTITTTAWIAITLDNNVVTSQAFTAQVLLESLPEWGRVSISTSSSSAGPTNTPTMTDSDSDVGTSPGMPATAGIIVGTLVAVIIIIAMAGTYYLWQRRRQVKAHLASQETKVQLHGESMGYPVQPQEMDANCLSVEIGGDKRACFELDSTCIKAELYRKGGG